MHKYHNIYLGQYFYRRPEVNKELGSCNAGEKAKKKRTAIIKTGIRRRIKGGGGNGGSTSGNNKSNTSNTTITMMDNLAAKESSIKLCIALLNFFKVLRRNSNGE